jgi:serralysin
MAPENADHYCICISSTPQTNGRAAVLNEAKWKSGAVISVSFLEGDPGLQQRVRAVAEEWTTPQRANGITLQFQDASAGPTDVRIAFQQGKGSWSYLGVLCQKIPVDQPTMNFGWLTPQSDDDEVQRVVAHEMGHALGLIHEHQNPKGGIKWNEPAVIADLSGPPNNWDEETIRHNVLDHYDPNSVTATDVDGNSIMMYPIPAAWTLDGFSAGLNREISPHDTELIHSAYP